MNKLNLFNNKDLNITIRAILVENKPYLIAIDIAKSLGYKKPRDAIKTHCRKGVKYAVSDNHGIKHITWVIPESDVYRLIMRSNMPRALEFQDWIVEKVLPAIREHGMYATEKLLNDPELFKKTVDKLYIEYQKRTTAQLEVQRIGYKLKEANENIREMEPKAKYHDVVLRSKSTFTSRVIGKEIGMTAQKLHHILHEKNIIYLAGDRWLMYSKYQHMGYMDTTTHIYKSKDKISIKTRIHNRWTEKGRRFIHRVLNVKLKEKTD